jgi:hypothetical protein
MNPANAMTTPVAIRNTAVALSQEILLRLRLCTPVRQLRPRAGRTPAAVRMVRRILIPRIAIVQIPTLLIPRRVR